jgi:hypothetical protein
VNTYHIGAHDITQSHFTLVTQIINGNISKSNKRFVIHDIREQNIFISWCEETFRF